MSIGKKLVTTSLFSIALLVGLVLTGWLGYRSIEKSFNEASLFERQSMHLQMLFRGVNEAILTEGTSYSIQTIRDAADGFEELSVEVLSGAADERVRGEVERRLEGRWQALKAGLGPFLRENAVRQDAAALMEYGQLLAEGDLLMNEVLALSEEARVRAGSAARHAQALGAVIAVLIIMSMASLQVDLYRCIAIPVKKLSSIMAEVSRGGGLSLSADGAGLLGDRLSEREKRLARRVSDIDDLAESFENMLHALDEHIGERRRIQGQLERLAALDELTQAYNRNKFEEIIGTEMELSRRKRKPLSVIIFDIDSFKAVNDSFGHLAGDHVLRTVAELVRSSMRDSDFLVRWGGEEFLVLAPEAGLDTALLLAERLRRALSGFVFDGIGCVTASFGVAEYGEGETKDSFILKADRAMYRAKRKRNKVELAA